MLIPLTQGKFSTVDDADALFLGTWKWHVKAVRIGSCVKLYAARNRKTCDGAGSGLILMHRVIASAQDDQHVDHWDGDGLNNRRENLRLCSQRQNNAAAHHKAGKSGYRGVYLHKGDRRWTAKISHNDRSVHIGLFDTAEEAARAYDRKSRELNGEFAVLNFPNEMAAAEAVA